MNLCILLKEDTVVMGFAVLLALFNGHGVPDTLELRFSRVYLGLLYC